MTTYPAEDGVIFVKNVMIPMSDGTHLAMDLHVPECDDWANTPQPLLLEYIPYRKDDSAPYTPYQNDLAKHGFVGARLDCRGTGSSEGVNTDEYSEQEPLDAVEAIEWIATQSWSGKIGMIGSSYGGFTSVQVAAHKPPNLTTIIPIYFTDDRYTDDCHYRGGAWRCYYDIGAYGISMVGMNGDAAVSRVQRGAMGGRVGAAPREQHALHPGVAGPSNGWSLLATWEHPRPIRGYRVLGFHDRGVAGRLPQPASALLRTFDCTKADVDRTVEPLAAERRGARSAY